MATIRGTRGYDVLNGTAAADRIYGYAGDDVLSGGRGADTLNGGAGIDTVDYSREFGTRNTGGGYPGSIAYTGVDIDLTAGTGKIVDVTGHFSVTTTDTLISIENVVGSRYNDTIRGGAEANAVYAHNGDDYIDGRGGNDSLFGEAGNDTILGGRGEDLIDGGSGIDTVSYFGEYGMRDSGNAGGRVFTGVNLDLAAGTGTLSFEVGTSRWTEVDTIRAVENAQGTNYADTINGSNGANVLDGGLGNDILDGRSGNDYLFGNAGDDVLFGGAGNDTLVGGEGNDILSGGTGFDELAGGLGADRFVQTEGSGTDRILDYVFSQGDVIDLLGAPGSYVARQEGAHIMIYDNSHNAVVQLWDYNLSHGIVIV